MDGFAGRSVLIVAGGPSVTPSAIEVWRARCDRVVAINNAVELLPGADLLWFTDRAWYEVHAETVAGFRGAVATLENYDLVARIPGLHCLRNMGSDGFHPEPDGVMTGANGGYQALHLMLHARPRRIVLLGYDFCYGAAGAHWHGSHPAPLTNPSPRDLVKWTLRFDALAEEATRRGIAVLNASPVSVLTCFERAFECARSA
ncbi:MAG: hypothetical protein R8L07_03475 [Alphaproteobacteria bacterium]|nr:hypothetical protein [Alphaproteobacteria bacterium]